MSRRGNTEQTARRIGNMLQSKYFDEVCSWAMRYLQCLLRDFVGGLRAVADARTEAQDATGQRVKSQLLRNAQRLPAKSLMPSANDRIICRRYNAPHLSRTASAADAPAADDIGAAEHESQCCGNFIHLSQYKELLHKSRANVRLACVRPTKSYLDNMNRVQSGVIFVVVSRHLLHTSRRTLFDWTRCLIASQSHNL